MLKVIQPYLPYAHVLGAIVVTVLLSAAEFALLYLIHKGNEGELDPGTALKLGVSPAELETDQGREKVARHQLERFSSDQFRNRLSDLAAVPLIVWGVLWTIVEVVFVFWVGWRIFAGETDPAFMWLLPAIVLAQSVVSWIYVGCCWLITGRVPGAAKVLRDQAAKILREIESQSAD